MIGWMRASWASSCSGPVISIGTRVSVRGGELLEDVLADPPEHAPSEPLAEGVEVPDAGDFSPAVGVDRVQGAEPPFRLQGHVVDPLDDRGQLVDPVLHRRAGQDEPVGPARAP